MYAAGTSVPYPAQVLDTELPRNSSAPPTGPAHRGWATPCH